MSETLSVQPNNAERRGGPEKSMVHGEIDRQRKEQGQSQLASTVESTLEIFNTYISSALKDKGTEKVLSRAEAATIRQDLAKELRAKPVGGEIIKEIKAELYYDTGKQVVLPTDTGDANFKIIIFFDEQNRKYKFRLEAINDSAQKLESN